MCVWVSVFVCQTFKIQSFHFPCSDKNGVCRAVWRSMLRALRQRLLPSRMRRRLLRPQGHRLLRTSHTHTLPHSLTLFTSFISAFNTHVQWPKKKERKKIILSTLILLPIPHLLSNICLPSSPPENDPLCLPADKLFVILWCCKSLPQRRSLKDKLGDSVS